MDFQHMVPYLKDTAHAILGVDSPTGFARRAVDTAAAIAQEMGYAVRRSRKGNLTILVEGRDTAETIGLCAHLDTLGLMVRAITPAGELMFTKVGGSVLPSPRRVLQGLYGTAGSIPGPSSPPLPCRPRF